MRSARGRLVSPSQDWAELADVAGPVWLVGLFTIAMIVISGGCAGRLVISRLRQRATEADADAVHVVMGVAMAGMLAPRLSFLPSSVWEVVFGAAAAWFASQAVQARRGRRLGGWRCSDPGPHAVECGAMTFMFLAVPRAGHAGRAPVMPMAGMHESAGAGWSFPVLAVVLALFMLGYVLWTADRLTSLARADFALASPAMTRSDALVPAQPGRPILAPRLAACYKIAMGVAMGYMLIMTL